MLGLNTDLLKTMASGVGSAAGYLGKKTISSVGTAMSDPATAMGTGLGLSALVGIYNVVKDSRKADASLFELENKYKNFKTFGKDFGSAIGRMQSYDMRVIATILERQRIQSINAANVDTPNLLAKKEDKRSTLDKILFQVGYDKNPIGQLITWVLTGQTPTATNKVFGFKKPENEKEEKEHLEKTAHKFGIKTYDVQILQKRSRDIMSSSPGFEGKTLSIQAGIYDVLNLATRELMIIRTQGFGILKSVNIGGEPSEDKSFLGKLLKGIGNIPGVNATKNVVRSGFDLLIGKPIKFLTSFGDIMDRLEIGLKTFFSGGLFKAQTRQGWEEKSGIKRTIGPDTKVAEMDALAEMIHLDEIRNKILYKMLAALEIMSKTEFDKSDLIEIQKKGPKHFNPYGEQFTDDKDWFKYVKRDALLKIYNESIKGKIEGIFGALKSILKPGGLSDDAAEKEYEKNIQRVFKGLGIASDVKKHLKEKGIKKKFFGDNTAYNTEFEEAKNKIMGEMESRIGLVGARGTSYKHAEAEHGRADFGFRQYLLQLFGFFDERTREEAKVIIRKLKKEQAGGEANIFSTSPLSAKTVVSTTPPTQAPSIAIPFSPVPTYSSVAGLNTYFKQEGVTLGDQLVFMGLANIWVLLNEKISKLLEDIKDGIIATRDGSYGINELTRKFIEYKNAYDFKFSKPLEHYFAGGVIPGKPPIDKKKDNVTIAARSGERVLTSEQNFILVDSLKESADFNKKSFNVLDEIKDRQPTKEEQRYTKQEEKTRWEKLLNVSNETKDTLKGKISHYLRDTWEKMKFGKKKDDDGKDSGGGFFSSIFSGLGTLATGALGMLGFKSGGGILKAITAPITGLISTVFSGIFGAEGLIGSMFAGGRIAKVFSGILGSVGGILKFGAGLLKKALLPLTLFFLGKDAYSGWSNAAEISGSEHPTFFQKFGAGISGLISGLSFGLIEPKTIYSFFSPVAGWISDKMKELGSWFMTTKAGTNFDKWRVKDTFAGFGQSGANKISGAKDANFFQRIGAGVSGMLSSATLGMVTPDTFYGYISDAANWVKDKVSEFGSWFSTTQAGTNFAEWKVADTLQGAYNAKEITGAEKPNFFQRIGAFVSGIMSSATLGMVKPKTIYGAFGDVTDYMTKTVRDYSGKVFKFLLPTEEEITIKEDKRTLNERIADIFKGRTDVGFIEYLSAAQAVGVSKITGGIITDKEYYDWSNSFGNNIVEGLKNLGKGLATGQSTDKSFWSMEQLGADIHNAPGNFISDVKKIKKDKDGMFGYLAAASAVGLQRLFPWFGLLDAEEIYNTTVTTNQFALENIVNFVKSIFLPSPEEIKENNKHFELKKEITRISRFTLTKTETPGFFQAVSADLASTLSFGGIFNAQEIYNSIYGSTQRISKVFDDLFRVFTPNEALGADEIPENPFIKLKEDIAALPEDTLYSRLLGPVWTKAKDLYEMVMGKDLVPKPVYKANPQELGLRNIGPRTIPRNLSSESELNEFVSRNAGLRDASQTTNIPSTPNVPFSSASSVPSSMGDFLTQSSRPVFKGLGADQLTGPTVALGNYKISSDVYKAIQQASAKYGVPLDYMLAMAAQESGFNPSAKAGTSSATGLYQFINDTWQSMWKGGNVPDPTDPFASADAGARYALLASQILGTDNPAALYLGHFLGPFGARKLLSALQNNPDTPASAVVSPKQMWANSSVFRPGSTVLDIYKWSQNRMNNFISKLGGQQLTTAIVENNNKNPQPADQTGISPAQPIDNAKEPFPISPYQQKYLDNQKRSDQNIQPVGKFNIEEYISSITPPPVEAPKTPEIGPLVTNAPQPSNNVNVTNVSSPVFKPGSNYEQKFDPQLSYLDLLFNSVIVAFTNNASKGFVFGDSLNANPQMI